MSADDNWEIRVGVTCTEEVCEDLMVGILEFVNTCGPYGAAVAATRQPDDEDAA